MGRKSVPVAHAILDGLIHTDSAAASVTRGSLIHGNSTPLWAELTIGDAGDILGTDGTDVLWRTPAEAGVAGDPQNVNPGGRLCLTSATPVHVSDAADQTTLFYAFYKHDVVPLFDGTNWATHNYTELSIAMAADTDFAADTNYDVYIFNDSGTLRLVTGTAWTNGTTRSAAIARLNGVYTNGSEQTARFSGTETVTMPVNQGLYVGTIRTTSTVGTTTMEFGGAASGGDEIKFYVWNMYNRIFTSGTNLDTDDSWLYTTSTFRNKNNSASNRGTLVVGLNEDAVYFHNQFRVLMTITTPPGTGSGRIGFGVDTAGSTTPTLVIQADVIDTDDQNSVENAKGIYLTAPGLGFHFWQAQEWGAGSGAGDLAWYGDNGGVINNDIVMAAWM